MKYRKKLGGLDLTAGVTFRGRPIVIAPKPDWSSTYPNFWDLAYHMDYTDSWYYLTEDSTDYDYYWYNPQGELIAETDTEFYDNIFENVVKQFYHSLVEDYGWNFESSLALGLDYYHYGNKFWFHTWLTVYPKHYALSEYIKDIEREMDYDFGLVMGWKLRRNIGVFMEGRHLSYFNTKDITNEHFELKTGINLTIF